MPNKRRGVRVRAAFIYSLSLELIFQDAFLLDTRCDMQNDIVKRLIVNPLVSVTISHFQLHI